jgi:hypothetical protein
MKKLIALIALVSLFSCEKIIEYDLPNPGNKITVQAFFTQADTISALVGESSYVLGNSGPTADPNAQVYLYRNEVVLDTMMPVLFTSYFDNSTGREVPIYRYYSDYTADLGQEYRIEASKGDLPKVSGSTTVPAAIQIELVSGDSISNEYEIQILDNAKASDQYLLRCKIRTAGSDASYYAYMTFTDPSILSFSDGGDDPFDGSGEVYTQEAFVSGEFFVSGRKNIQLEVDAFFSNPNDKLTMEVVKITEEYFKFKRTAAAYANYFELFSEPAQIFSNVNGGYGIIASGALSTVELENK